MYLPGMLQKRTIQYYYLQRATYSEDTMCRHVFEQQVPTTHPCFALFCGLYTRKRTLLLCFIITREQPPGEAAVGQAEDRDRSCTGHRCPVRPRGRRRRLRGQRGFPPRAERARPDLGGRYPQGAERLPDHRPAALAEGGDGATAQASAAERGPGRGRAGPGEYCLAAHCLAPGHQRTARG